MLKAIYISYDGVLEPLGQSQVLPYLKELSNKNTEFSLVSFEKKRYLGDISQKRCLKRSLNLFKIKWFSLVYHKSPAVLSKFFDIFYGFIVCVFIVLKERSKVVHARSYVASFIAWILKKIFRLKFIFDMRGFWADERIEGRIWKSKSVLYKAVKYIERYLLRDADEIIVLTNKARTILENWGYNINKVSVMPSCVDIDSFKFIGESRAELRNRYGLKDKFVFIHAGSLEYWYMKDKMLDYFKSCAEIYPWVHFLILSHDSHNKIRKLILDRKIDLEYFTILKVPFNDMPQYLSIADVGILFITPVFSKSASSPTKFAEYLSCGLPVISNENIVDIEEYVLNNNVGVIVRDFNEGEYKKSFNILLNLIQDKGLRSRCRSVASNNFSHKLGVEKYYEVYSRLK